VLGNVTYKVISDQNQNHTCVKSKSNARWVISDQESRDIFILRIVIGQNQNHSQIKKFL